MSLTAYIRYDNTGRIVPGGPVLSIKRPTVGNWQVVEPTAVPTVTLSGKLRAFIKLDGQNKIVASSLVLAKSKPATGKWIEVNASYTGPVDNGAFLLLAENGDFLLTESGDNLAIAPTVLFLSTEEYNQLITEDNNNITI